MSGIYSFPRYFCEVLSISVADFSDDSSKGSQNRIRSGAKRLWSNGWGRVLLFSLASCLTIVASGCGAANSIAVGASEASPQSSPQLTVSTASLSFGSAAVNTPTMQSLTLTSTGTAPVTVSSAAVTGAGFTVVGATLPMTLNPLQAATLQVQFNPASAGAASGQIAIVSNSATGSPAMVALTGTGAASPSGPQTNPQLAVNTSSLSFGSATVNTPTTQSLTLTSTGTAPVTVSSAAVSGVGFTIVGASLPMTLNPLQTATLKIQFNPTSAGAASGQVSIVSDSASGNPAMVALSGTGTSESSGPQTSPQLAVSASSLSFGSATVNTTTTQSLTLTSTGTAPVTVTSITATGAGFTIVGASLPMTLNPLQAATVQMQFNPTSPGAATGQIAIVSDSVSGSPAMVAMTGTGTTAPGPQTSPQLAVSASSLSFGSVTLNTPSTQSLTLTSTGTAPVTVTSVAATGTGFTIAGASLPMTLNPQQTTTLQVQFNPTSAGAASGQIAIVSNSVNGSQAFVALAGTGTTAAPGPQTSPQLAVSSSGVSFGSVTLNTPSTQSLTLTSTGTAPVTVNSVTATGSGFSIVGASLPMTLNPQQTTTLQVQFNPTSAGAASGQISIVSNSASGSPAAVALTGTGTTGSGTPTPPGSPTSPQLGVSASSLSFGSVTVNTPLTRSLTLTSTGTAPVTVNSAAITGAGFTIVAQSFPMTLNPTQSVTLQIQFLPTAAGAASGQIAISSNSATGGTAVVALGGTGTAAGSAQLSISTASLSFGSLAVNSTATQSLTLTSTGTTPVTVNSATITGAGFTLIGGSFPVTLNPTQTVTLTLQFKPATTGALTGQITVSSNSTSGGTAVVGLSGTGTAVAHEVDLSWIAPTNAPDVAGYNIYRAAGSGSLVLLNSSLDVTLTYVDKAVSTGSYSYVVKSVDSSGMESTPSNEITVTVP